MPKKVTGEQLKKVVSTKLSEDDFNLLQSHAKIFYNRNDILQPTVSHMLRMIVKAWANGTRKKQNRMQNRMQNIDSSGLGPSLNLHS